MTDADLSLIRRIAQQDAGALEQLYDRYSTPVYSLALFITNNPALAGEATQNTFMQLWERASSLQRSQSSCESWLLTFARQSAIDVLGREQRRTSENNPRDDRKIARCTEIPEAEASRENGPALNLLPPAQREVILLSFYRGLTQHEMADCLDLPLGTVKSHVRDGIEKLRLMFRAA